VGQGGIIHERRITAGNAEWLWGSSKSSNNVTSTVLSSMQ